MKTKFPFRLWLLTGGEENLFTLDKFALETFTQLAQEASKP